MDRHTHLCRFRLFLQSFSPLLSPGASSCNLPFFQVSHALSFLLPEAFLPGRERSFFWSSSRSEFAEAGCLDTSSAPSLDRALQPPHACMHWFMYTGVRVHTPRTLIDSTSVHTHLTVYTHSCKHAPCMADQIEWHVDLCGCLQVCYAIRREEEKEKIPLSAGLFSLPHVEVGTRACTCVRMYADAATR